MKAVVIAVIWDNNEIIGYRVMSIPENLAETSTYDASKSQLKYVIENKGLEVENVRVEQNNIVSNKINFNRYVKLDRKGQRISKNSPLIIVRQIIDDKTSKTLGYIVSDYRGKVVNGKLDDVIKYAEVNGIANGKLVEKNGEKYISAIVGEFEKRVVKIQNTESRVKVDKKQEQDDRIKACPDYPWSIDEFKEFMGKHRLYYELTNNESRLANIDYRISVFRVPNKVNFTMLNNGAYKDFDKSKLEELVVDDSELLGASFDDFRNLKRVRFEGSRAVFIDGYRYGGAKEDRSPKVREDLEFIFGAKVEHICGYYNRWVVKSEKAYRDLMELKNHKVTDMYRCFNGCELSNLDVEIPYTLKSISYSFNNTSLSKLDFSKLESLSVISSSFEDVRLDQEELVIQNRNSHIFISGGSFSESEFNKLIIYNTSGEISHLGSLLKSGGEIIVTGEHGDNSDRHIFRNAQMEDVTIRFLNREKIYIDELRGTKCKEVILNDGVKVLCESCMELGSFDINIPGSVEEIRQLCFGNFGKSINIDLSGCTNLKKIHGNAFSRSIINSIVLPDTVEIIGKQCFFGAAYLKYIYLPKSIKDFGHSSFKDCGYGLGYNTTVFVYKRSEADRYCNKPNLKRVYVESIEDAINEMNRSDPKINEAKKNKLIFVMNSDPEYSELIGDEYINRAEEIIKIMDRLKEKDVEEHIIKRNKQFINANMVSIIGNGSTDGISIGETRVRYCANYCNSSIIEFINLITKYAQSYNYVIDKHKFAKLMSEGDTCFIDVLIESDKYKIYKADIYLYGTNVEVILITESNPEERIIFCTLINTDKSLVALEELPNSNVGCASIHIALKKDTMYPLSSLRKNYGIPYKLLIPIAKELKSELLLLGYLNDKRVTAGNTIRVYFYSLVNRDILECEAVLKDNERLHSKNKLRFMDFLSLSIIKVYKEEEYENDKEIQRVIEDGLFSSTGLKSIVDMTLGLTDQNTLKAMKESKLAYDDPSPCLEWEISNLLQEYNINKDEIEKLTPETLYCILDTSLVTRVKSRLSPDKLHQVETVISDGRKCVITSSEISIKSDIYNIIHFKSRNRYYIHFIGTVNNKTISRAFLSSMTFRQLVREIKSIKDIKCKPEQIVDNKPVDLNSFYIVRQGHMDTVSKDRTKIRLLDAINRANGCVYTLLDVAEIGEEERQTYKILRFKSLEGMYKANTVIEQKFYNGILVDADREAVRTMYWDLNFQLSVILGINKAKSKVMIVRDMVMKGYPNGFDFGGSSSELFNLAAKQPESNKFD